MLYKININQKAIIDNGWKLRANHIAILECIVSYINTNATQYIADENGTWYWVSYSLIIEQLPMFAIQKAQVARLVRDLADIELLNIYPFNREATKTFFQIGKNYTVYKFQSSDPSNKNVRAPLTKMSDPSNKNVRAPLTKMSDYNNTNNNNTNNNTNDNNAAAARENFKKNETEIFEIEDLYKEKEKSCAKKENDENDIPDFVKENRAQFTANLANRSGSRQKKAFNGYFVTAADLRDKIALFCADDKNGEIAVNVRQLLGDVDWNLKFVNWSESLTALKSNWESTIAVWLWNDRHQLTNQKTNGATKTGKQGNGRGSHNVGTDYLEGLARDVADW
jgi:hypothetical protein